MTTFYNLSPNSGHLLITDNFLRPVGVRDSEVLLDINFVTLSENKNLTNL